MRLLKGAALQTPMQRRIVLVALVLLGAGCTVPDDDTAPGSQVDLASEAPVDPAPTPETPAQSAEPTPEPSTPPSSSPPPADPEPAEEPAPENGTEEPASSDPRPFDPEEATQPCDSLEFRSPLEADPAGLASGWPMLTLDVVMLADPTFVAAHPEDWRSLLEALLSDASAQYERQFSLTLRATLIDRLPDGSLDPSATTDQIRPVGRGYMLANHPDVAYDFVAVILGSDYAGTVAGQVDCVGGAYTPDTAFLWAEYENARDAEDDPLFEDAPLKVFMHEAAHLFGAHHHYSDCGESLVEFSADNVLGVCDVMINDIGLASFRFGPMNRLVVRSFVEEHGLGEVG